MAANLERVELWMPFDNIYQPALSIPVDRCQHFSVHPLAWLRYLGFTIYGKEGHISTLPGGPEVDYYQPDIPPGTYYYVSQEPLLLDPDGMEDRTSDASTLSTSRLDFRDKLVARDGRCVMTASVVVQACHLIPHAKGDQYMINLVDHRNEPLDGPPLDTVNDSRNGILLAAHLQPSLGASHVAFLRTPNFAMTCNDVDLVKQPTADALEFAIQPSDADTRLTFQHFNLNDSLTTLVAPHNSDARQSDSDEWPPPLLFDIAYGIAALKTWGVVDFVQFARESTRGIYYDENGGGGGGGDEGDTCGGGDGSHKQPGLRARNDREAAKQKKARNVGRRARNTEEVDYADVLMALWTRNANKSTRQAHAMRVDRSREKVRTWLESAES